ncbi:MAG: hypothetical protein DRH93_09855 [Deltaproteobacteria bacterium]|nr:MAG: hypothetical protein DRH93_09855 [Deltaproteobacteria bacterium]
MRISKENKKLLKDEFAFIIDKMKSSEDPDEMLYYYSGIYGMLKRIFNIDFSHELVFSHFVIEKTHQTIIERLGAMKAGQGIATFNKDFGPKFIECTEELMDGFFDSKQRMKSLNKIVVLSFTTTGNGYYLNQKGMIDIFSDKKQLKEK